MDDVATPYGQLIGSIRSVVVQRDDLEEEHRGGGVEYERLNVTELTAAVWITYDLLNWVGFHMGAWRNVVREGLTEKRDIIWILS